MKRMVALGAVAAAVVLLVVPFPTSWVEQVYARTLYPAWARIIVPVTGSIAVAWFDALLVTVILVVAATAARAYRGSRSQSAMVRVWRGLGVLAVAASGLYLWFLASWGLNYQRAPLRARLDYDRARVSPDSARDLARAMVSELNRLHPVSWSRRWPELDELPARLAGPVARTAAILGLATDVTGVRPKPSVLQPWFRWAGIDGLTNPFLPEIIVNADALPMERPFIVAHEWGHLLGLAHEAEAGFAAWRVCQGGDDQTRYSAWLSIYGALMAAIPVSQRQPIVDSLADGPRRDLRAIAARYAQTLPAVRTVAWTTYDQYLRSQRVAEGIASYDAVIDLILGVRAPQ